LGTTNPSFLIKTAVIAACAVIGVFMFSPIVKMIFNSPEMHIWHHAYHLPENRRNGVNFGLTLAVWDYLFKTAHIPHDGKDIRLGFPDVEKFPEGFIAQSLNGLKK
jgi:sterol desaturase/sphingolipid hydroxylase (fatty acid hydroxylase superfamily)